MEGLDALLQQPAAAVQPAPRTGAPDTTSPLHARASACAARAEYPAAAADDADPGGCGKHDW